jgi:probable rRNA maturation factor
MQQVVFNKADKQLTIKGKTAIKAFIPHIFKLEGKTLQQLNYVFCSDKYLLQINKDFLQHDDYTDIITFDLTEDKKAGTIGEIYISLDRVKENATLLQQPLETETLRVLFHGALHLCGYKDKTKAQAATMRAKEEAYIQLFKGSTWNK